ncbi:MAG: helix-turn-helix domain-containing protein [Chloroflexota bacterium]
MQGAHVSELGDMLRGARQKRNLSLIDVAEMTHIRLNFLEALENGEYGHLPGPAYITGFLRNYAQAVGLYPDDVVQEYYASRPVPQPTVKPATRVLANGHERRHRTRLLWIFSVLAMLLGSGYAFKLYTASYAQKYSPSLITPANLGATPTIPHAAMGHGAMTVRVRLHALAPAWVRVTVDGTRRFQGILRPRMGSPRWVGRSSIYVASLDGEHVRVTVNGTARGLIAGQPGFAVSDATSNTWRRVS